ncbi:EF-hand calcium-binding domain-containing protein 3 isoform X2 [Mauremys reevesii]|uniref:EF-hand calcium-binding domain-containing protein 3 isoform X2 n=1 Tax=Mauremys reevesii TaxID=260615 RepID=UPI00193F091D|nr:EF-hand calcium-binding domain-containing protein 3 isoform X2 [Mauremys reevesii]
MMCMTGTRRFTEFEALQDAFNALSKISGDKIEVSNLPSALKAMGIHLTPRELQEALTSCPADESGRVNVKEFMKVLTNIPRFSEYVALQDALETVSKIKEDKVPVSQLEQTLNSLGVHLPKESLQEGLTTAAVDGDGKVNFKDFLTSLGDTQNFSELEALQNATNIVSGMQGGKIHLDDLKSTLENLGISLKEAELQETLKAVAVDERGTVNLKEFLTALASIPHFSDSAVLQDAIGAFSRIKEDKVDLQDMDSILASLGISVSSEELQEALQEISPDDAGKVNFKEVLTTLINTQRFSETSAMQEALDVISKVEGDKIAVSHLESALANIGITLPKGELEEALKHATVDGDGKVNFKEFLKGLTSTKRFSRTLEMEGAVKAIGVIKEDTVDVHHLESIMRNMGIHLTPEEIQKALKHVTCEEGGKVNLKDFMTGLTKTRRFSQAEKDRVDVRDLDSILDNMGIYLTNEELQEALRHVTVDADGKVYLSKFLQGVRALRRFSHSEGKRVDIRDLDSLLAEMGMHLTQEELQEVLKHVIVDGDGKVNVSDFTKNVISTRRASKAERDRVATSHLDSILGNMGIFLTEEELQEALKHTEIDAEGKVNLSEFMKSVQRLSEAEGEKVDVDNLDSILANMGIHLTAEEFQKALGGVTRGADGKVELKHFMESVMGTRRPSQCERDTVDLQNLDSILDSMGVHLTNEELQEVLTHATVDANGKVNLGEFMKGVKTIQKLPPGEEDKVDVGNLDSVLANMGVHLTPEELQEALKHCPVDRDGTVGLSAFMKSVMSTRRPSQAEKKPQTTFGPISETNMTLKSLPKKMMLKPLPKKTSGELSGILLDRNKCKAAKNLTKDQLEAFHQAYSFFSKDADGNIDLQGLETTAEKLGISLTEQEAYDELSYADMDGDGKVNFSDFLTIVSDNKRFIQAVAPEKGCLEDFDSIDATGILLFEVLSKLVEMSALPRKAMLEIVSYYRQKFLASTGRRAWINAGGSMEHRKGLHALRKSPAPQRGRITPMSAFAGAARISVMNDKELEAFVETLRASSVPSDSPYAQVPIFPWLPNRDGMSIPKPKKDLQKLEMQRRKEPISSFENHFFQKRNWLREATAFKPPNYFRDKKNSLSLGPHLMERRHRLTIEDLGEIRLDVKRVTEMYKQGMALKERNRMLRLWRRLHGGQIGLESGNHSFYHTFSTYSWSWNARQELVTPNELQQYDNKLYRREHPSARSDDSEVKGGIRKGKERK